VTDGNYESMEFSNIHYILRETYFHILQVRKTPGNKTLFFYMENVTHMCFPIQKHIKTHVF
jgi:hypothetical protein